MKLKSIKLNIILSIVKTISVTIFPLITFPYVSRIIGAENLGKVNFGNSIVSYFALIAAFGISSYAIREGSALREEPNKISSFINQIFSINVITTIISFLLLILLLIFWDRLFFYRELIVIQSITIGFATIGIDWLYSIYEDYLFITLRTIIVQFISLILLFIFVKEQSDYINYAIVTTIALGGANLFNFIHSRKYCRVKFTFKIKVKHHIFPIIILFLNSIATTIYLNSDITILGVLKGDYTVGIYSVAVKIYSIFKQVINAVIIVTLPRLSYYLLNDKIDEYNNLTNKILNALIIIILPMVTGIIMLSKEIVSIVGGKEYVNSYASLIILTLAVGFSVLASFYSTAVLMPHKKEKKILVATIVSAVVNLGLNFVFIPIWAEKGTALTTLISEFIVFASTIYYSRGLIRTYKITKNFTSSLIGCFFILLACFLSKYFINDQYIYILTAIVSSTILYMSIMIIFKNRIILEVIQIILGKITQLKKY